MSPDMAKPPAEETGGSGDTPTSNSHSTVRSLFSLAHRLVLLNMRLFRLNRRFDRLDRRISRRDFLAGRWF